MSLCGCEKNRTSTGYISGDSPNTTGSQISGEAEFTTSNNAHTYIISKSNSSHQSEKTLTILNTTSGQLVQTIHFSENEWFTKKPIYLIDVSFDGHVDILVPYSRPASAGFFQAYIWDKEQNEYTHIPSYENIPNVAIDIDNKLLLAHRTADKTTSYSMYSYNTENFCVSMVRCIYWEPQEDSSAIIVKEFEYDNETEKLLKHFSVSAIDSISIDKTDSKIAPYFSNHSVWNLDSDKWNNYVIPYSEFNY